MWYFTAKKTTDQRPVLRMHETQEEAEAALAAAAIEFPDAELGEVFEDTYEYHFSFPHVMGEATVGDGVVELMWSDGERTPKPE